jgi:hypothetical protein
MEFLKFQRFAAELEEAVIAPIVADLMGFDLIVRGSCREVGIIRSNFSIAVPRPWRIGHSKQFLGFQFLANDLSNNSCCPRRARI